MAHVALLLLVLLGAVAGCSGDEADEPEPAPAALATPSATPAAVLTPPSPAATSTPAPPTATDTRAAQQQTPTPTLGAGCCGDGERSHDEQCDDGNLDGGDGCAANCTVERVVPFDLRGRIRVQTGLFALELEMLVEQDAYLGGETGETGGCPEEAAFAPGEVPLTVRAGEESVSPIAIPGLVCACLRSVAVERCGDRLLTFSGTDCLVGADCSGGPEACGDLPCLPAHGAGNAMSGVIDCRSPVDVDYLVEYDETAATPRFSCTRSGGPAPPGSAFAYRSASIGTIPGTCALDLSDARKGPDGVPCTDDDPPDSRGVAGTIALTTGTAAGRLRRDDIVIHPNVICGDSPCITDASGEPFSCDLLAQPQPSLANGRLCSAFVSLAAGDVPAAVVSGCLEVTE